MKTPERVKRINISKFTIHLLVISVIILWSSDIISASPTDSPANPSNMISSTQFLYNQIELLPADQQNAFFRAISKLQERKLKEVSSNGQPILSEEQVIIELLKIIENQDQVLQKTNKTDLLTQDRLSENDAYDVGNRHAKVFLFLCKPGLGLAAEQFKAFVIESTLDKYKTRPSIYAKYLKGFRAAFKERGEVSPY